MSNKDVVVGYFENTLNKGDLSRIDAYYDSKFIAYDAEGNVSRKGISGAKDFVSDLRKSFPDLHVKIDDVIEEKDKIAIRWSCTGTHKGPLMDIAPTGKSMKLLGVDIYRLEGGKIVEEWDIFDSLSLMKQLGVMPVTEHMHQ
jgi:steroid delta-isomerase-like uncharacterized protein